MRYINLRLTLLTLLTYNIRILSAKLSPLFYLLITQLTVYKRTTTRFNADDKVVYQPARRATRLASVNS